jgi:hypothetical protein
MDDEKKRFNYSMVRVVCKGQIKPCDFCKDQVNDATVIREGYCTKCGRPMFKNPGDLCGQIVGYYDRRYKHQDKVHFTCRFCRTITTI